MLKAILIEIKETIFKTWFHLLRFIGLLMIPLLYGFSYVFAFWDPFSKVDQLPIAIVTHKNQNGQDAFGDAVGRVLSQNDNHLKVGELNMTIQAQHIYADLSTDTQIDDFSDENLKNFNLSLIIPQIDDQIDSLVADSINSSVPNRIEDLNNLLKKLTENNGLIRIINNFKQNYVVAFGLDLSSSMLGTQQFIINILTKVLQDPQYLSHLQHIQTSSGQTFNNMQAQKFASNLISIIENTQTNNFELVRTKTHMQEYAKYGYGLAPFFISIAMWIGAMVMTFSVHRKIYNSSTTPTVRYFAKWFLIIYGILIQSTILMVALYFIGFNKLGHVQWGTIYCFTILMGIIFSTIIQAIRFMIPSRNIGIFTVIFLLILQIASAGGLFPVSTQSHIFKTLNLILPAGHSITVTRELMFEPRLGIIGQEIAIMLIYPALFMPVGIIVNRHLTIKWYIANNWKLPQKIAKRGF